MDYKEILQKGNLIYSSQPSDKQFREWRLIKTICSVVYYITYDLSKLDKVILLTLQHNGKLYENQLARILGFNVKDDFDSTPKRYADQGERDIFNGILSQLTTFGLININEKEVSLSPLGKLALKKGVKHSFYRGTMALMQCFDIAQKESTEYKMFPFRDALGITSSIQGKSNIPYDEFNHDGIEEELYSTSSELIARLSLQCSADTNICRAEETTESRMSEIHIDFRLYEYEDAKYPFVFYNNEFSEATNLLLHQECNNDYINQKIHIGEYLHLIRESHKELNYTSMMPYIDVWYLNDFLESEYLKWADLELFAEIAKLANGSHWSTISVVFPTDVLKVYLEDYKDSLDWIALSSRYDDDFIVETAITYPWDFESLSAERSIDFVKRLIVIPQLHEDVDWDWESILERLDDEFVLETINFIPYDMYSVTEKYISKYDSIIAKFPKRKWNWDYISTNAGLDYLLQNINAFAKDIHLDVIMTRAFASVEWAEAYCDSSEFAFAIIEKKEWLQNRYNANSADYIWTIKVIDWHEKLGFISWKSVNNADGFECNKRVVWDSTTFEKYHDKEFSVKGLNHITSSITDVRIIDVYPDFKWVWSILSTRDIVVSDIEFIKLYLAFITYSKAIPLIAAENLSQLYAIDEFRQLVTEQGAWNKLTAHIEKKTILQNISDSNWDWSIITQNFCDTLNFAALSKLNVLDRLDWDYISKNADIDKIKKNLDDYEDKWKWATLTARLDHDFIVENLPEYYLLWDWGYITESVLTEEDLARSELRIQIAIILSMLEKEVRTSIWSKLTARYSTNDILDINRDNALLINKQVSYEWDYSDLYNRNDFDVDRYLKSYQEFGIPVDWDALSASKSLNKILSWDKKVIKGFSVWENVVLEILGNETFHWNFQYLSTLSSINWCDNILRLRSEEWDWNYLSEKSKCFSYNSKKPNEILKHIEKFSAYLDFAILSKRRDVKLTLQMLTSLITEKWDWKEISSNRGFELSAEFVTEHEDLSWDWYELTSRRDCRFTIEYIKEHKNRNWDWSALSRRNDLNLSAEIVISLIDKKWDWKEILRRKDIEFTEEHISKLVQINLDWKEFSRRKDFFPTMNTLNILKDKDLDWNDISRRMELHYNVILFYKHKLNWSILTNSTHIDKSNPKTLETFKEYLDWNAISYSPEFKPSKENLQKFKDNVNWTIICKRPDFVVDEITLSLFEDKIDWKRISQSGTIVFTQSLVDRFKDRWDWVALAENPAFRTSGVDKSYKSELNLMEFYNTLKSKGYKRPFVYHFTHMFNAIEVIRSRKILSRNRAMELGLLKYDAAGSVVHRSAKAHPYARFYYRTGTQTQFYNECLGKLKGSRYYGRAEDNGLPMCPMPVFFKFDLQEVLAKHSNLCYYSTGNLQTNWAQIYKVIDDPHNIDADRLYSGQRSKEYQEKKQQEFLIKNEFDFSELKDYQIICYDREETEILKSIFCDDPICEHIYSIYDSEDVFEHENPPLKFEKSDERLKITTSYNGDYMFQIESTQINKIRVFNSASQIKAVKKHVMQIRDYVSVECGDTEFEIYYVNMSPRARSPRWLVYQYSPNKAETKNTDSTVIENFLGISLNDDYSPEEMITALELIMPKLEELYNTRVRHYVVKKHTLLVCEQFEKYAFDFDNKCMNMDLMRLVLAVHDIGKAIDRSTQHEHTLSLVRELWENTPFTEHEFNLVEVLLRDDHLGSYFQNKYDLSDLKEEIVVAATELKMPPSTLLQYKMILYQCDIASYTKDAGGLKYLEHMFEYKDGEKIFNDEEGIIIMSSEYAERYNLLKLEING